MGFGYTIPPALAGGRQSAAARNLGAPKGVTKAPAKAPSKPPAAPKTAKVSRPAAPKGKPSAAPRRAGGGESLALSELSQPQLAHRAVKMAQAQGKAETEPIQRSLNQVKGEEAGTAQRYKGYGETAQNTLGSIAQAQEASAKTFENQAAENALQAGKSIETTGQNQATLTGGYVAPELKAELNAEGRQAATAGAAGNQFAAATGNAGTNLIAGLRAAAVQRNQEGLTRGIPNAFAKQTQTLQNQLGTAAGRVGANTAKIREGLESRQFNQKATASGLGLKQETLGAKVKGEQQKNATTIRGQNLTAKAKAEALAGQERGRNITQAHYEASDKTAKERARTAVEKATSKTPGAGKTVTGDAQLKLAEQVGSAYETIRQLREQKITPTQIRNVLSTGYLRANVAGKPTTLKYSKVANSTLVQAAFELWDYHRVSPHTQATLKALGLTTSPQQLVGL